MRLQRGVVVLALAIVFVGGFLLLNANPPAPQLEGRALTSGLKPAQSALESASAQQEVAAGPASGPVIAFLGSDCSSYKLPEGAVIHQVGSEPDENRIWVDYSTRDTRGKLVLPLDSQAATCTDRQVRAIVSAVQETNSKVKESMCNFINDLLAGRVQLPPDKRSHFDLEFAHEWYRKNCPGG